MVLSDSGDESAEELDSCQDLRVPGDIFGNEEVGDYFVDSQGYSHVRTRKDTAVALSQVRAMGLSFEDYRVL